MKKTILFLGVPLLFLIACKQDSKSGDQAGVHTDTRTLLAGHWIALDFCSRVNQYGSILGAMTNGHVPYAYGISFDPTKPDSAICYNGIEKWSLPVKYNADTLELIGARAGKSVFLVYHSQGKKDMTMFDSSLGAVQMDDFIKSSSSTPDGYKAFTLALNHSLFSGVFGLIGKGATAKPEIQFTPGGFIFKWNEYDRYEVCTAGDCFVMGNNMDIMTVSKSKEKDSDKMYGFKYSAQNDTLTLYNLINANPEEKGNYQSKGIAYRFFRKKAD